MSYIFRENLFKKILQGLFFIALLSPLVVDRRLFFPYVTGSALYFRLMTEILFFAWIIFIFIYPKHRPKLNFLSGSFLIYFLALTAATIFSTNAYLSFWGDAERMTGLFGLLHFLILFFVGVSIFKEKSERNILLNVFVAISMIVAVYGILQRFGFTSIKPGEGRIIATLGNAATLASYLIFGLFFSAYSALKNGNWVWRIIYGSVFFVHLAAIFLTGTRGAFLGIAAGFLVGFFVIIKYAGNKRLKKTILGGLIFLIVLYGTIYLSQGQSWVKDNPYLYRITHFSFQDNTIQGRLISWKAGMRGFLVKPVLGWGFEGYAAPFNKYFDAKYYDYAREEYFDRAHNIIIEHLATTGILGLGTYFLFLAAILNFLLKIYKREKDFVFFGAFSGLLIAYFVQDLFMFDLLPSLLGLMVFLVIINNYKESPAPASQENQKKPPFKPRPALVFALAIILFFIFYYSLTNLLIKPFLALKDSVASQVFLTQEFKPEAKAQTYKLGMDYLKKSVSHNTFLDLDIRAAAASTIHNYYYVGNKNEGEIADLDFAIELYNQNLRHVPDDTYYNYKLAELLDFRYAPDLEERFRDEAKIYIDKAIATSPQRVTLYYILMENLVMAGKFDEAIDVIKKAISLNDRMGSSYWELTKAYFQKQDFGKTKEALIKAINLGHRINDENMQRFMPLFEVTKSRENEIAYLELVVKNGTTNYLYYSTLANFYFQRGDKEKAIWYAQESARLNPATKEKVDKFIEEAQKKL